VERRTGTAIVGAGILGLAHAFQAAQPGQAVTVFDRSLRPAGASVRNFGMIWPVGQAPGPVHQIAIRSRAIWAELLERARIPHFAHGSLHAVYREDEAAVAQEFAELGPQQGYRVVWQTPRQLLDRSPALVPEGLRGGLWSAEEIVVDPRLALPALASFLAEQYGVEFRWGEAVTEVQTGRLRAAGDWWRADRIIICSGDDFETLLPRQFRLTGLTRCKLQMLRTVPQPPGWSLGPALAGPLTLRFYPAFRICPSLPRLAARIAEETPELDRWGIHILASPTQDGAVTLGDSHEYGLAVDIFDREEVEALILREADRFLALPCRQIAERWHGVYAKHPEAPWIRLDPEPGVTVVTGLGGSGMTLAFGLVEKTFAP